MAEATQIENTETETESSGNGTESKRTQRSKRTFIDADGNVVKRMEEACGARYTVLHNGNPSTVFERQFGDAGDAATMFAVFGFHTKLGNVLNTVVNADDYNGGDPSDAIQDWIDLMDSDSPQWSERKTGVGSRTKFDKDIWAAVLSEHPSATMDAAGYREKLDTDASWYAKIRNHPELLALYYEAAGTESEKPVDSLL